MIEIFDLRVVFARCRWLNSGWIHENYFLCTMVVDIYVILLYSVACAVGLFPEHEIISEIIIISLCIYIHGCMVCVQLWKSSAGH